MAPFRPSNLNKRAYPGNASIIGPTATTSCSANVVCLCTTRTCFGSCTNYPLLLGCRCECCGTPCCCRTFCCEQTTCTRTQTSGRWKSSEQYLARTTDSWGDTTTTTAPEVCISEQNVGITSISVVKDYKGFFIKSGIYFVAPSAYQISDNYCNRSSAVTCANTLVSCSWYVPGCQWFKDTGHPCRTYWDSYSSEYWTDTEANGQWAYVAYMGSTLSVSNYAAYKASRSRPIRAVRDVY